MLGTDPAQADEEGRKPAREYASKLAGDFRKALGVGSRKAEAAAAEAAAKASAPAADSLM